jgi:hypothetical protein
MQRAVVCISVRETNRDVQRESQGGGQTFKKGGGHSLVPFSPSSILRGMKKERKRVDDKYKNKYQRADRLK